MEYHVNNETITFNSNFNESIDKYYKVISKCSILIFENKVIGNNCVGLFNKNVDNLPISITEILFGYFFDKSVDNLPENLKIICFGRDFNKTLDNLPHTLTHIYFVQTENKFNQPLDNLPINLSYLSTGYNFNLFLDNLPYYLKELVIGESFNQSIENLPILLKKLYIYNPDYSQNLNYLPDSIEYIEICTKISIIDRIPKNLKTFCSNEINHINLSKYGAKLSY